MNTQKKELSAYPDTYFKNKGLLPLKRKPRIDWVRKAIETCHTQADWQALVKSMTPKDQIDALLRVQPKLNISESNGLQVILNLNGVDIRPIEGQVIDSTPALKDHNI